MGAIYNPQARLNQLATEINRLKNGQLALLQQIQSTKNAEATKPYYAPRIYPSSASLTQQYTSQAKYIEGKQNELTTEERSSATQLFGLVSFNVDEQFETHPDASKTAAQIEANNQATDINNNIESIQRIDELIQVYTTQEQTEAQSKQLILKRAADKAEEEAIKAEKDFETATAGKSLLAESYENIAKDKRKTATEARKNATEASSGASSTPDSARIKQLKDEKATLVTKVTEARNALAKYENTNGVVGVAQAARLQATASLMPFLQTSSDYMDEKYIKASAPPAYDENGSYYAQLGYAGSFIKDESQSVFSQIGKHLSLDEYTDPKERTYVKKVDTLFSMLLFVSIGYGAYKYALYEDGTADASDALTTLSVSTYAVAGLAVAYALLIGYATLMDKIEENRRALVQSGGSSMKYNPHAVAEHEKMALRYAAAGALAAVGFAVIAALQSTDLTYSTTGMMLAPIAAILFGLSMHRLKEAEIASKTEHGYKPQEMSDKLKENIVGVFVALLGLAIVYNGAIGMNEHKGDADALTNDIKFMTRAIAALFALGGLASGYQKARDAEDKAQMRKVNLVKELYGEHGQAKYFYEQNGQIVEFNSEQKGMKRVEVQGVVYDNMARRTDARMHFALGAVCFVGFALLAIAQDLSPDQKIAATLLAAASGMFFAKWGNNSAKHDDKFSRVTIGYDNINTSADKDKPKIERVATIKHTM